MLFPLSYLLVLSTAGGEDAVTTGELFVIEDSKAALPAVCSLRRRLHTVNIFEKRAPRKSPLCRRKASRCRERLYNGLRDVSRWSKEVGGSVGSAPIGASAWRPVSADLGRCLACVWRHAGSCGVRASRCPDKARWILAQACRARRHAPYASGVVCPLSLVFWGGERR